MHSIPVNQNRKLTNLIKKQQYSKATKLDSSGSKHTQISRSIFTCILSEPAQYIHYMRHGTSSNFYC